MRGSKTPRKTELEFRAKLLDLGVVSAAARAVKIPVNTGYELARRAEADSEYVKARNAMRDRVVPEFEHRLMRLVSKIEKRIEKPDLTPAELAGLAVENNLKSFSYQNPKPQYLRGLVDLYGKLTAARKTAPDSGAPTINRPAAIQVLLTDAPAAASGEAPK